MSPELALKALAAAPDATLIIDEEGVIQFVSRQAIGMFGYATEELVGRHVELLMPEPYRARHGEHRNGFFKNVRVRPMGPGLALYAMRRDGSDFPVEISLSPLQDGERPLVLAAIRDITERMHVETELRHLQSITDTALSNQSSEALIRALLARLRIALHTDTATILLTDEEGDSLTPFASDGMEAEFGGELRVPIGRGVAGTIAMSEGPVILEDLSKVEVISPVLGSRVKSLLGTPLRSGTLLIGVVHAGSATHRKFSAHDVRLMTLAADRIGMAIERARLYESELAARRAAEAADKAKSRFLATASHDLRQPLQTVSLLNGALQRTRLEPLARQALVDQEQAIDAMSHLLNALLNIGKLESGAIKPDLSDFTVAEILDELHLEFASIATSRGLDLQIGACDDSVYSDPSLVGQVLRNLLANAVKYTRAGSVAVRCVREAAFVRLEVLDTGIGIPTDQLAHIYEEFYQVGVPANASREGYGLGLSIVRQIVSLLDARIEVASTVGAGSRFSLILPAGKAVLRSLRKSATPESAAMMVKARVLLVEDDQAVRNATRMLLRSQGFEVATAVSLFDAMKQAAEQPQIDLIVTDYHLQDGETGMDVIIAIRAALDRPVRAVVITGDTSAAMASLSTQKLLRVASKPLRADELLGVLRSLLEEKDTAA